MSTRFKPFATVAVIIEHEGRFLMVEEPQEDQDNRLVFGMPSGHIDANEGIVQAALREGKEEAGFEIELTSFIGIYDYVKDYETIYRFCFAARPLSLPEKLQAQDPDGEILAVHWYSKEEIYSGRENWRTRLVGLCMDDYLKGVRYPLELVRYLHS